MKKIAIITGAAGGLGKEIVKSIITDVDELWAIGRNVSKLEALKAELDSQGGKIVPLQMDLSDIKSYDILSTKLASEGGAAKDSASEIEISWLVNNAGAGRFAPSTDFSTQELAGSITTHCTAVAAICNICIPYMKRGDIIMNIASQSAFLPLTYINLYASTKAFVYSYTRALRAELKETGIKVTAVCPGWIKTDLIVDDLNGKKVNYPFIDNAAHVAKKAVRAARKGKALSINNFGVRYVTWLQRHMPQEFSINCWKSMVKKFVE